MRGTARMATTAGLVALFAAATGWADPAAAVPPLETDGSGRPVAAEYRTTVTTEGSQPQVREWRYWRDGNCIERENVAARTAERWERDGRTLFLTRYYHADRKGIEYRSDDLEILNATPAWSHLTLLVDPTVLAALRETDAGWLDGTPVRRYTGSIDGARWDVTMRTDLMLPLEVRVERGESVEVLQLLRAAAREQSPFEPESTAGYEVIDFADLGDRERDPFVIRVSAAEGYTPGYAAAPGHTHAH